MKTECYTEPIAAFEWIKKHQCPNMVRALSVENLVNVQLNLQRSIGDNKRDTCMWFIAEQLILVAMDVPTRNFFGEAVEPMTPAIHVVFANEATARYKTSYTDIQELVGDLHRVSTNGIVFPLDERIWLLPYLFRIQYIDFKGGEAKFSLIFDQPEHCKRALAMNLIHKNVR